MSLSTPDSFGGVSMRILYDQLQERAEAQISVRPIPGGNVTYVDLGGTSPDTRNYRVYLASTSAWNSLRGLVGTQGSLVDTIRGNATAILMSPVELESRTPTSGEYIARVSFLVVG